MAALERLGHYTLTGTVTDTSTPADTAVGDDHILFGPRGCRRLTIYVTNTGQALTDFAMRIKAHPDADWKAVLSGSDWATATSMLLKGDSALNTLASGATSLVQVDVRSAHAVDFMASVASSSTALTILVTEGTY